MDRDLAVHLLDVGHVEFSDSLLMEIGGRRILVDGAHSGDLAHIRSQVTTILGEAHPHIDLLVVSHTHKDHIGCLPKLTKELEIEFALLADPRYGWGTTAQGDPVDVPAGPIGAAVAGLREEPIPVGLSNAALDARLEELPALRSDYQAMIDRLQHPTAPGASATTVVIYGRDSAAALVKAFKSIELKILGPTVSQLKACADGIGHHTTQAVDLAHAQVEALAHAGIVGGADSPATIYRRLIEGIPGLAGASVDRDGDLVNLQSIVMTVRHRGQRILLTGDMELVDPASRPAKIEQGLLTLKGRLRAQRPFAVVKVPHHGSANGLSPAVLGDLGDPVTPGTGVTYFGIITGRDSDKHPDLNVLGQIQAAYPEASWARTDRNGQTTLEFASGAWTAKPAHQPLDDMTAPALP
jgi:beta-lactamase superfamily II metal-dependent hydrolase